MIQPSLPQLLFYKSCNMWKEIAAAKVIFPGGNEGLGCLPKFRGDGGPPKDICWSQSHRSAQHQAGDPLHEKLREACVESSQEFITRCFFIMNSDR